MAELVAAIVVVCLPALKSLIHRAEEARSSKRSGNANSHGNSYKNYPTSSSHIKLSSGRDAYSTTTRIAAAGDEDGSDVELNSMQRRDVIYKSEHVSVTYQQRGNTD